MISGDGVWYIHRMKTYQSSIPQDLDQTDTAAVRMYVLRWDKAHPDKPPPRDWYRSWEIYLDQLRRHTLMRDYCDQDHDPGQYCLVCDAKREEATAGQWISPNVPRWMTVNAAAVTE